MHFVSVGAASFILLALREAAEDLDVLYFGVAIFYLVTIKFEYQREDIRKDSLSQQFVLL